MDHESKKTPHWRRTISRVVLIAAVIYIGLLVFLMINETALVYPGSKFPPSNLNLKNFAHEKVKFQAADGTRLVGWFLPRPLLESDTDSNRDEQKPRVAETILLCHGNAEDAPQASAWIGDRLRTTLNADVFVFDYRGYGNSEGSPTEAGLLDDAESALQWLCQRTGVQPEGIIMVGHSIGGGPACRLAAKYHFKALILQRTFSALSDAAQANYPMFPVRFMMRNQFRSTDWIKKYEGPVFQSHPSEDSLIPIRLARELFDCAPTEHKQFVDVPEIGHFDALPESYWVEIRSFVESINEAPF